MTVGLGSRRALLLTATVFAASLASCLNPTLPLPPPGDPELEWEGPTSVRVSGVIRGATSVSAVNLRTQLVFGQRTRNGAYSFLVEAVPGDELELYYVDGVGQQSDSLSVELPLPRGGAGGAAGVGGSGGSGAGGAGAPSTGGGAGTSGAPGAAP